MKRAPGSTMRTTSAGPRLRCFLSSRCADMRERLDVKSFRATILLTGFRPRLQFLAGFLLVLAVVASSQFSAAQGDCVVPHGIAVPQVRGQIFDAFGIAVPFATVTVIGIDGTVQTTADDTGRFSFNVPAGHYVFKAEAEGFSYSSAELKVGRSWQSVLGRQNLKVMLGFGNTYCPWVTTSRQKFEAAADANMSRLKKSAQISDASQTDDSSSIGGAVPAKEISETNKTAPMKDTPQSKETSQTHATQK